MSLIILSCKQTHISFLSHRFVALLSIARKYCQSYHGHRHNHFTGCFCHGVKDNRITNDISNNVMNPDTTANRNNDIDNASMTNNASTTKGIIKYKYTKTTLHITTTSQGDLVPCIPLPLSTIQRCLYYQSIYMKVIPIPSHNHHIDCDNINDIAGMYDDKIKPKRVTNNCLHTPCSNQLMINHNNNLEDSYGNNSNDGNDMKMITYLRIHLNPRTFPVHSIDWHQCILSNNEDYVIVNKPAGIPTLPTLSNGIENTKLCIQSILNDRNELIDNVNDGSSRGICSSSDGGSSSARDNGFGLIASAMNTDYSVGIDGQNLHNNDEKKGKAKIKPRLHPGNIAKDKKKGIVLYPPHRLDEDTEGILLFAKSSVKAAEFSELFAKKLIKKSYRMIVASHLPEDLEKLRNHLELRTQSMTKEKTREFSPVPPMDDANTSTSSACLSRLTYISPVVTRSRKDWMHWCSSKCSKKQEIKEQSFDVTESVQLVSSDDVTRFQEGFMSWLAGTGKVQKSFSPRDMISFCEVELDLVTGKTYQCRGQLQAIASSLHIAGDNVYSGITSTASPSETNDLVEMHTHGTSISLGDCSDSTNHGEVQQRFLSSPHLALQAYHLRLHIDTDMRKLWRKKKFARRQQLIDETLNSAPRDNTINFTLPSAWWSPLSECLRENN